MRWLAILLTNLVVVKSQDFTALLGPLLGGGGGGGGIGNILAGLGGGGGGKGPDIGSLFQLGAGLLGNGGGGGGGGFPLPIPGPKKAPGRGGGGRGAIGGGPTNVLIPDYSDYQDGQTAAPAPPPPPAPTPPAPPPPPPPQKFTPVGRSEPRAPKSIYHYPNARTFVSNQATVPPPRFYAQVVPVVAQPQFVTAAVPQPNYVPQQLIVQPIAQTPVVQPVPQPQYYWNNAAAAPTAAPIVQTPPPPITIATLAPLATTRPNPQLLAHNTARMIREIATFSDVHHGPNDNYGAVQTLMEAFFEALADPKSAAAAQDPTPAQAVFQPLYDGTELGANRPLTNKLFESDMVLTVEQMKGVVLAARDQRRGGLRRGKRKVITGAVYRWPKAAIPYRFKEGDETWRNLIRSALKNWEKETCVRWEENGRGKDHVIFFRGSGCYSNVGRTGGSQMISIGYGCEDKGVVAHEVGHSLGFWHEQSRPDRDQYITLNKHFIIRGTDGNFERRTTQEIEDMGLPYDLGSVMHYGPNAFTKDWNEITIRTNDKNYQRTIGQRVEPSFIDVKQVNRLYCNDVCAPMACKNGGYADPNNCSRCKCPPGLAGKTCDEIPQGCGGELFATPVWQELGHRGKGKCYWRIRTNNARIRFILSGISYRCETTCKAYVEIKHNSDFQQTGFRACCNEHEIQVTSEQAEVLIISDSTELNYETGFNLRYIQDSGLPLPKPPPAVWVPGSENRGFRGAGSSTGPIEKFILNAIPKVRDPRRPWESIASIVTEYSVASLLGIRN
ncbi:hypothetical protein Q1695_005675 [Nippostrongylus brasiliensis]|nr:hypothetical protein Q1695_005675 [Nippostrongylus brasiliensis]